MLTDLVQSITKPDRYRVFLITLDFPDSITINSIGEAAERFPLLMGNYRVENNKTARLRKVYKKTDEDRYIFFNSKFEEVILRFSYSFEGLGDWAVARSIGDDDMTRPRRRISTRRRKRGLLTPPSKGWRYWCNGTWKTDPSLEVLITT